MDLDLKLLGQSLQQVGSRYKTSECAICETEKLCVRFDNPLTFICATCLCRDVAWEHLKKGMLPPRPIDHATFEKSIGDRLLSDLRLLPVMEESKFLVWIDTRLTREEKDFLLDWDEREGYSAVDRFLSGIMVKSGRYTQNSDGSLSPQEKKVYEN